MIQILTLAGSFAVGIVLSLLGAVKLPLAAHLGIDDAQVGALISTLMFSCVLGGLIAGPLVDALGHKRVMILGFSLCGACLLLFANAGSFAVLVAACMLLGFGGLCVSTVSSTLAPAVLFGGKHAAAAQNFSTLFFGLGAFLVPFLVVFLLGHLGFRTTVSLIAILSLLPLLPAFLANYPPLSTGFQFQMALGLLARPVILLAGATLFCYVALEASMAGWVTTYLTKLGASEAVAGTALMLFWLGVIVSRLIASVAMAKSKALTSHPHQAMLVIAALTAIAILCIAVMFAAKTPMTGVAAIVVLGLCFGPTFPTVVGVTLGQCDRAVWGSAFGIIFALGFLGATLLPALIGVYSQARTIQDSLPIALLTAVALLVFSIGLWRLSAPRRSNAG